MLRTALAMLAATTALSTAAAAQVPERRVTATKFTLDTGHPLAPEQAAMTLSRADLQLRVDPASRTIQGTATLDVAAKSTLRRVVLDLDRSFAIQSVAVNGRTLPASAYRNPEGRLSIDLPSPVAAGRSVSVAVRYSGTPHVAERAPWDGGFVWTKTQSGEPWIATAIQGNGCDLMWPCIDHPSSEIGRVDLHVTVPAPLAYAGNGVLQGMEEKDGWRTYHWRSRDQNPYNIALNIGPYERITQTYRSRYGNSIPIEFWHLRGHEAQARELVAEIPPMLEFFERTIGPYPFADEKVGMAETPHLGMEHQTMNAYGNEYKPDPYGFDWLLQHEFAHEYFGNQVTNSDWDHMWIHEGLGSYMQPLYSQYLHGEMAYQHRLGGQRAGLINRAPVVSGKPRTEQDVYSPTTGPGGDIYAKGSVVMHALRSQIGDEDFFEAVRRLVYGRPDPRPGNFKTQLADTPAFVRAVNESTGRDLGWFFDVYLYEAALPDLVSTRTGGELQLRWVTPNNRPFPLPVEVQVGDQVRTVQMTGNQGRLSVPADAYVLIDPRSKLLRRMPHIERHRAWQAEEQRKAAEKAKAAAS